MKRLICLCMGTMLMLIAALLLPACSGDGEGGGDTTAVQTDEPQILLADENGAYYTIVRSDRSTQYAEKVQRPAALALRAAMRERYGVELRIVTDFATASYSDRTEKEIVIGTVEGFGTEYTYDEASLGTYGYSITVQGDKIVIAANSEIGFGAAIEAFLATTVKTEDGGVAFSYENEIAADSDAVYSRYKLEIDDKTGIFGICYSMWFDMVNGAGTGKVPDSSVYNVTEILAGKADWGPVPAFHYWGKPAQGYYRSTDAEAAERNLELLGAAGVDFLMLDYTFIQDFDTPGSSRWNSCIQGPATLLLNLVRERILAGKPTPRVVFWTADRSQWENLYTHFYSKEEWEICFVYWNDKPLIMEWTFEGDNHEKFTVRGQNGLRGNQKDGQWSFLNIDNEDSINYGTDANGNRIVEHMSLSTAVQETYMTAPTAHGRNHGIFWYKQWVEAFEAKPKIVTLTWWNEWVAQRFEENGETIFVDNYNMEYSRDIEPLAGGHGDQYYRWMIEYIRAYRAGESCPVLVEEGFEEQAKKAAR